MAKRNVGRHAVVHKREACSIAISNSFLVKVLACAVSLALVFGLLPHINISNAYSEEVQFEGVTLLITDDKDVPLEGASVDFSVVADGDSQPIVSGNKSTTDTGKVEILEKDKFYAGILKLTTSVTKTGYSYASDDEEIAEKIIDSEDQEFVIKLKKDPVDADEEQDVSVYNADEADIQDSDTPVSGNYIEFAKSEVPYVVGEQFDTTSKTYTISDQKATYINSGKGDITYEIVDNSYGMEIDDETGKVTISQNELKTLIDAVEASNDNKGLVVEVKATKAKSGVQAKDSIKYELVISLLDLSNDAYSLSVASGDDGWYKNGDTVTVTPKSGYRIANVTDDSNFDYADSKFLDTITLTDEGQKKYTFCLKEVNTGKITKKKTTDSEVKIDTVAPNTSKIAIEYPSTADIIRAKEIEGLTFGFFKSSLEIKFKWSDNPDETSGLKKVNWNYKKSDKAIKDSSYIADKAGELDFSDGSTSKTLTLSASEAEQFRGNLEFTATDKAGNASDKQSDSNGFVLDSVAPKGSISYSDPSNEVNNVKYYGNDKGGKADVTLSITEANLFSNFEDLSVENNSKMNKPNVIVTRDGVDENREVTWSADAGADDKYSAVVSLEGDGEYTVKVAYTDNSGNVMEGDLESQKIIIDKVAPVVSVSYADNGSHVSTLPDAESYNRDYFNNKRTATVRVTDENFNENTVYSIVAKDASGSIQSVDSLISESNWEHFENSDVYTKTIAYNGDSNYTFELKCEDYANNATVNNGNTYFTVDTFAPRITNIESSKSLLETVLGAITFGFYNAPLSVTVTAEDSVSGVSSFVYGGTVASGASGVNNAMTPVNVSESSITYDNGRSVSRTTFKVPDAGQFNGNVYVTATDRCGNSSAQNEYGKRLVVDNIAPNVNVSYNTPYSTDGGTSYYDGAINGTVTINEANFYAGDVYSVATRDGSNQYIPISWSDINADVHIGTFSLAGDGDYHVTISYTDKSGNAMPTYTSNLMIIDTQISEPSFTIKGQERSGDDGGAYKDDVNVAYSFNDHTLSSSEVKLTKTRFDEVNDLTEELINVSQDGENGSGSFDIQRDVKDDGVYVLSANISDRAGHTSEAHVKFIVNRYGSVYEYSDYLMSLIKDGGQFVSKKGDAAITNDLVITEYNADAIEDGSLKIGITRDGESVSSKYDSNHSSSTVYGDTSASWNKYVYSLNKSNFASDGLYKITLSSSDATGNTSSSVPDNSIDAQGNKVLDQMNFTVDTTKPDIRNITNLDKEIVDAQELPVKYTLVDVGGLDEVEVFVNGDSVEKVTNFGSDRDNHSGEFTIHESDSEQNVRLVVKDRAGNITDTASDDFNPGDKYGFVDKLIVSTNLFVRWFANKPLFWGSIAGFVLVVGLIAYFVGNKRKKDDGKSHAKTASEKK